jgi:hypothetical protein
VSPRARGARRTAAWRWARPRGRGGTARPPSPSRRTDPRGQTLSEDGGPFRPPANAIREIARIASACGTIAFPCVARPQPRVLRPSSRAAVAKHS